MKIDFVRQCMLISIGGLWYSYTCNIWESPSNFWSWTYLYPPKFVFLYNKNLLDAVRRFYLDWDLNPTFFSHFRDMGAPKTFANWTVKNKFDNVSNCSFPWPHFWHVRLHNLSIRWRKYCFLFTLYNNYQSI